jgi:PleD family two-component response regulator
MLAMQMIRLLTEAMPVTEPVVARAQQLETTALQAAQIVSVHSAGDELEAAFSTSRPTRTRISMVPKPRVRILLVDEEQAFCSTLQQILSSTYDVAVVHSASHALAHLEQVSVDVILCGLSAPIELHEPLRELRPEQAMAIIFLSSRTTTNEGRAYIGRLSNPSLGKPFEVTNLKKMIDQRVVPATEDADARS